MIWPRISAIGMALLALQNLYGAASMLAYLLDRIASPFIPAWVFLFKPARESHTPREFVVNQEIKMVFVMLFAALFLRILAEKLWKRDANFEALAWLVAAACGLSSLVDISKLLSRMNDVLIGAIHLNFGAAFFMPLFGLGLLLLPIVLNAVGSIGWAMDTSNDAHVKIWEKQIGGVLQNFK
jgi:hypothetical protein